jgi:hypothetical protein
MEIWRIFHSPSVAQLVISPLFTSGRPRDSFILKQNETGERRSFLTVSVEILIVSVFV